MNPGTIILVSLVASAFSEILSPLDHTVHSCCSTQFAYEENTGCYFWEENEDIVNFPQKLFGKFRLVTQSPRCNATRRMFVSVSKLEEAITDSGTLIYGGDVYLRNEFCIDSVGSKVAEIIVSQHAKCNASFVHKCCKAGEAFDAIKNQCQTTEDASLSNFESFSKFSKPNLKQRNGFPQTNSKECAKLKNFTNIKCWRNPRRYTLDYVGERSILKFETSSGVFVRGKLKTLDTPFCIEKLTNFDQICSSPGNASEAQIVFYCAEADEEISPHFYAVAMSFLWIATSGLLLVAAVINVTRIQKNSHGWVLFCYLITSALLNFTAGIFIVVVDDKRGGCDFLDFATKFLYSSTLCWMTMVNVDLWWSFRKLANVQHVQIRKRLPYYFLFAWSLPTATTATCWFVGKAQLRKESVRHCILYDHALIPYSSGPIVFLIVVNLCLFVRTTLTIQEVRRSTRHVLRESRVQRESFRLFSKLFLMSGPIWILRVILLALQFQGNYLTWYGVLIETIFSLPDIAFFLLVVLHPKVTRLEKLPWLRHISNWFHESSVAPRYSFSLHDQSSLRKKAESLRIDSNAV